MCVHQVLALRSVVIASTCTISSDNTRSTLMSLQRWGYLLFGLAILLALTAAQRPDGQLHIFFLETAGDAALIQTPSGAFILIDGGSDPVALVGALGHKLPFWKRNIDVVILTAPDHAHLPGLVAAIARYQIVRAITPPSRSSGAVPTEWRRRLAEQRVPLQIVRTGSTFRIDQLQFRVLSVGDGATSGMLLRLEYGSTSVVFAHNSGPNAEQDLATHGLGPASLVVFPWQRDPRTDFITAIAPKAIVFTDGTQADMPAELTLPEHAVGGARVYHERLNGVIEWISDGRSTAIRVERHYCSPISLAKTGLFSPSQSPSASCSKRDRS